MTAVNTRFIPRRLPALLGIALATLLQLQVAPTASAGPAGPRTLKWSGASPTASTNWSAIGNWDQGVPNPTFTDSLDFPAGTHNVTNNDVSGLSGLGSIKIESGYTITETAAPANDVSVTGGIQVTGGSSNLGLNMSFPSANEPETVQVDTGASLNASGTLSGGNGTGAALTKTGAGTLQLSGAGNTITGRVTISAGTLLDAALNGIPTTDPVTMNGGSTATVLRLTAGDQTLPSIDADAGASIDIGGHTLTLDGNGLTDSTTPHAVQGPISGSGGITLSPNHGSEPSYTVGLSASNPYSGPTTVSGGYLQVDGPQAASAVTLNGWGSLTGGGTTGSVHAQSGGTVYPADGVAATPTPTILNVGQTTLDGGSALKILLKGTSPGGSAGYSQLISSGTLDLTGAPDLVLSLGYAPDIGNAMTIVQAGAVTGTFAGKPDNTIISISSSATPGPTTYPARIHYTPTAITVTILARPTTTSVTCTPADPLSMSKTNGQPATCTATVKDVSQSPPIAPTPPTGTVTFSSSGSGTWAPPSKQCTLSNVPATADSGTCPISYTATSHDFIYAAYAPDTADKTHAASSNLRTTSSTVSCVPSTLPVSGSTICTVTTTDTDVGSPSAPAGNAIFTTDGAGAFSPNTGDPTVGSCAPSTATTSQSACQVTYTPSAIGGGRHNIATTYSSTDGIHATSSGSTPVTISPRSTATAITCGQSTMPVNSAILCTATVSDTDSGTQSFPGGSVNFGHTGSGALGSGGSCSLIQVGSTATSSCSVSYAPSAVGTHTISGSYAPNDSVHAASSSSGAGNASIAATTRTTSTSVSCTPSPVAADSATTCTATVSDTDSGTRSFPGGGISFSHTNSGYFGSGSCTLAQVATTTTSRCSVSYTPTTVGTHTISATYGPTDGVHRISASSAAVSASASTHAHGYNILTGFGGIYSFGDATYWGNLIDHGYPGTAIGLSEMPDGNGYQILTKSGALYSFGDAQGRYYGNLLDHGYPGSAAAIGVTGTGSGYSIMTAGGGLYSFGDAQGHYYGNLIDHHYPGAAVSFAWTASGLGYWILTDSGAIYSFGDAQSQYYGNLIDHGYPGHATSLARSTTGQGYQIMTTEGAIYSFGDAQGQYYGNLIDHGYPGPGVALSTTP